MKLLKMLLCLIIIAWSHNSIAKEGYILELVNGEKITIQSFTKNNEEITYTTLEGYPGFISIENVSKIQKVNDIDTYLVKTAHKDQKSTRKKLVFCLENIGQDVKSKNFSAKTFSGNLCGVTRWGQDGIGLNIYNSFFRNNNADLDYMLQSLKKIALRYGYQSYSILISDNENKLMIDRAIHKHRVQE